MSRADARNAYDAILDARTRDAASMERFAALATAPSAVPRAAVEAVVDAGARAALVDVRSPGEYQRGRAPRAINAPLFDDDERAAVGTAYKTRGRGEALVLGMAAAAPRLEAIVERAKRAVETVATTRGNGDGEDDGEIDVYVMCFRGGMRSSCVGWLLKERLRGARVHVVEGGYKAFRRWALERCGPTRGLPAPRVCVVGGRTGVGKTRALLALRAKGEQIIDLEGLANHAGSAFGWVGREPQPTSEHYSNLVACEWHALDASRWVFIEDEGPHVGRCSVDPLLFERMRNAPLVLRMVAPREVRLHTLVEDYATSELRSHPEWMPTMRESVDKLVKRLGGDRVRDIREKLEAGDFTAVAEGLLEYYDGLYDKHLMSKRKDRRAARAANANAANANANDDACSVQSFTSSTTEDEARAGVVVDVNCVANASGGLDEDLLVRDVLCAVALFECEGPNDPERA